VSNIFIEEILSKEKIISPGFERTDYRFDLSLFCNLIGTIKNYFQNLLKMNNKLILGLAGLVLVGGIAYLIITKWGPKEEEDPVAVNCGNNKIAYRYKDPSKAFPVVTREYNFSFEAASDLLKRMNDSTGSLSIGLEAKNTIRELQEKLNQDNITFFTALRSYFISCNNNPCNDSLQAKYMAFVEDMSKRMLELKKFVATTSVSETKGSVDSTYQPGKIKLSRNLDSSTLNKAVRHLDVFVEKKKAPANFRTDRVQPR